jgi:transposase
LTDCWPPGWDDLVPRDRDRLDQNKLFKVVRGLKARLGRLAVPLHRCRKSKHTFTQHQLLVLLVLRQWFGKSYREFCVLIEVCTALLKELDLRRIPHFTTLQKFARRVQQRLLDRLLGSFADLIEGPLQLALDSTGFSCTSASRYFCAVVQGNEERRLYKSRRSLRRHLKQSMAIDTSNQIILAVRYRYGPCNDAPDAVPILEAAASLGKVEVVVADKGYDSKHIRRYIWYQMRAESHIPLRRMSKHGQDDMNVLRRKQRKVFDEGKYHRRALAETVHSVEKRVMRQDVLATSTSCQHKELTLRAIAYDSRRAAIMGNDFY